MKARIMNIGAGIVVALTLIGCAQPGGDPSTAPSAPQPGASDTTASTTEPAAAPTTPATETAPELWETQDGAMRVELPEGWSVDDRSAMGEASEMYNRGPGWLNDLIVLDEHGNQMLWYLEEYGNDFVDCYTLPADIAQPVDPLAPDLRERMEAEGAAYGHQPPEFQIRRDLQEDFEWDGEQGVTPGTWTASLNLKQHSLLPDEDCGWAEEVWVGTRIAMVGAVGDQPGADSPASPIVFDSEQAARDWLAGDEAATLIEVLSSIEFSDVELLDAAP